jgi:hypothetical protein
MRTLDCQDCRMGFHCHRCLCCAPLEEIQIFVQRKLGRRPRIQTADSRRRRRELEERMEVGR